MVEKIEVRTTSGGFIEVTRCEEGVVWVDIKRGDGTTGISGRLDGFGPSDLAAALDPKLMTKDAAKDLREKYNQACKSSVANADAAYRLSETVKALEASQSHGAYQKLNDELAKAKAEVASLQGQVVGRGAALDAANKAVDLWQKTARDRLAQVATWEREATLRAGSHETLTAVAKVFQCPTHDVVCKAESLVRRHAELCTTVKQGEGYVAGETWKQRDARHRETIHQLKQENRNLRGKVEKLILDNADRARPRYIEIQAPTEVAHVMSLTKQLGEARNDVKAMQKEVYDLKLAGKICAEAMQEWRSKLTSVCGFTFPNLVTLGGIVRQICAWRDAPEKNVMLVKRERDDLQAKVDTWRKELTEVLEFSKPPYFDHFITKIRELKAAAAETRLVNDDATHVRQQFKAASVQWDQAAANFNRTINELRALASTESEVRKALENKHREWMTIKADHAKMLQLREADQATVKRCSDRVKELETRAREATAALEGRKS